MFDIRLWVSEVEAVVFQKEGRFVMNKRRIDPAPESKIFPVMYALLNFSYGVRVALVINTGSTCHFR